jgi:SAM-dependent methyltransferase
MSSSGTKADDARTIAYFSDRLMEHNISPLSLDWGSRASQELRFEVLAAIGSLAGASVLDVGCGLGDFHAWQVRRGLNMDYHGVDITPGMVAAARARFPGVDFRVGNVLEDKLESFDYVLASGLFYLRQHEPQQFMEQVITRLFEVCRKGVAFNSLSDWSPRREPGEFYADPLRTLEYCRSLTPRIVLRHDYHPRDFTLHLLRPDGKP